MSSTTTVTVPEGMSCVNAFHALWKNSRSASFFTFNPSSESLQATTVSSAEKVANLFKTHTYFEYEWGRMLKTDFAHFPNLEVGLYDREFGSGAAQKALNQYGKIPSNERFDKNDSYKFEELVQAK